jgi:hypothetical protein
VYGGSDGKINTRKGGVEPIDISTRIFWWMLMDISENGLTLVNLQLFVLSDGLNFLGGTAEVGMASSPQLKNPTIRLSRE